MICVSHVTDNFSSSYKKRHMQVNQFNSCINFPSQLIVPLYTLVHVRVICVAQALFHLLISRISPEHCEISLVSWLHNYAFINTSSTTAGLNVTTITSVVGKSFTHTITTRGYYRIKESVMHLLSALDL
jgi:hypothetical protein